MNRKSKVFGLLAVFVLSMSMVAGASAQSSDTEWVKVELTDPGGYICAVDLLVPDGSFGVWEFDGTGYVETTGDSTMNFYTDIYGGSSTGCDISIYFSGLENWGTGDWISPDNFSAYSFYQGQSVDPWGFGDTGVPPGLDLPNTTFYDFNYTLETVPNGVSAGIYEGTVNAFVSNTP